MSYDIVKTIDHSRCEPTLHELVRQAISFGSDRMSLVRRANETRGPALVIFMLGDVAIRELGPLLRNLVADQPQDPDKVLVLHENRPVYYGLLWLEENGLIWGYHDFLVSEQKCLAFYLVGNLVTDHLAAALSERRCMTSLI